MTDILQVNEAPYRPSLSFVIPVKDEHATLELLLHGICAQAQLITSRWEVIFVDDGSTDDSWKVILQLAAENPENVKAIRFRRNMGKADALASHRGTK